MRIRQLTPEMVRHKYLISIRRMLLEHIFNDYEEEQLNILENIIMENSALLNGVSPSFMYNGDLYTIRGYYPDRMANKAIHPSMLSRVTEHLTKKDFDFVVKQQRIENYVSNALIAAKHKDSLRELIPSRFHSSVNIIMADAYNIGDPMTEDEIKQFKVNNRSALVEFQKLFLESLLMAQ